MENGGNRGDRGGMKCSRIAQQERFTQSVQCDGEGNHLEKLCMASLRMTIQFYNIELKV